MRFAVIGGSGFASEYGSLPWVTIETPYGETAVKMCPLENGTEMVFLPRHGPGHRVPPHRINHKANVDALQSLSVDAVFATAAVGSLRTDLFPGSLAILSDFIDLSRGEVTTFFDAIGMVRHTDFSEPFSRALRDALRESAPSAPVSVHDGACYISVSGPRYETPAEVRLFASWGGDVVGMTVGPEATLAREAGLRYAVVAVVTNFGCGLKGTEPLSHADVEDMMHTIRGPLLEWIQKAGLQIGIQQN